MSESRAPSSALHLDRAVSRRALLAGTGGIAAWAAVGGVAGAAPQAGGYTNPVWSTNNPDPAVIWAEGSFYMYATNGAQRLPVLKSPNLIDWTLVGDGMPTIAPWCVSGRHWAPEVIRTDKNRYLAFYTAHQADPDQQAVSVAVSSSPVGPFVDNRTTPLVGQTELGGSIDPSPFRDSDGSLWLLWKNDGNAIGIESKIYLQRLSDDGLELQGEPQAIIGMDQPYETYTIEGPSVMMYRGRYYCFYSTGQYWNETYGVCWATAPAITGPWTKPGGGPIMVSNDVAKGPGHGMPIKVGAQWWYLYHAWEPDGVPGGRLTWLSRLNFGPNGPTIDGPHLDNPVRPIY